MTVKEWLEMTTSVKGFEVDVWKNEWFCCMSAEETIEKFGDEKILSVNIDTDREDDLEVTIYLTEYNADWKEQLAKER